MDAWPGQRFLPAVGCQKEFEGEATGSVDRLADGNHHQQVDRFLPVRRPVSVVLNKMYSHCGT